MRAQAQMRLKILKKELETGQAELEKVEAQRNYLRETILRIGGAVQVLEELLAEDQHVRQDAGGPGDRLRHTLPESARQMSSSAGHQRP